MRRSRTNKILSAVPPGLVPKQLLAEIKKADKPNSNKDKVERWLLSNDFSYYTGTENTSKDNTTQNNELSGIETKVIDATEQFISNFNTVLNDELNIETTVIEKTDQSMLKDDSIQNGYDILDLDAMEFVIDNGSVIQPEQNISSTVLVISKSSQIPVPHFPITVSQVSTGLDSSNEELIPFSSDELENYGNARKKRQPKSVPDPKSWNKNESKRRRLMGEMYTGYRRENNKKPKWYKILQNKRESWAPLVKANFVLNRKPKTVTK